jgi:hypothetical protein
MRIQGNVATISSHFRFCSHYLYAVQKTQVPRTHFYTLYKFRITHFLECEVELQLFLKQAKNFFLAGFWTQEDVGRILLGDNKDTRVVMLQQIMFPFDGTWISTGLPCTYLYISPHVYSMTCAGTSGT